MFGLKLKPYTPGYLYSTTCNYLIHFVFFFTSLFMSYDKVYLKVTRYFRDKFFTKDDYTMVTFNERCCFDIFIQHMKKTSPKRKILCTPLLHTCTKRVFDWEGYEQVIIDLKPDGTLGEIPEEASECCAALVVHVFGVPFNFDHVVEFAEKQNIPLFEDCVQGGYISTFRGNPKSTLCGWSGGHDKVPTSFGGGFCLIRDRGIYEGMMEIFKALPKETRFARFKLLGDKTLILLTQNYKWFLYLLFFTLKYIIGMRLHKFACYFRGNVHSGFSRQRPKYLRRPSLPHLLSMYRTLSGEDFYKLEREQNKKRAFLYAACGEKAKTLFPWSETLDWKKGSNFYCHTYVKDVVTAMNVLDEVGYLAMPSQSWDCLEVAETCFEMKKHLIILPNIHFMKYDDLYEVAELLCDERV